MRNYKSKKIQVKILIPASLQAENLSTGETLIIDFITRKIRSALKKSNKIQPYTELSRNKLRELAGGRYKSAITNLINRNLIQVFKGKKTGKESYSNKVQPDSGRNCGFCKKYKFHKIIQREIAKGEVVTVERALAPKTAANYIETAVVDCAATRKVVENFKRLEVGDINGLSSGASHIAQGIQYGITNARRKNKNGRLFHALVNKNSKHVRPRVKVCGESLIEMDCSAMHIGLLAHLIDDSAEKLNWVSMYQNKETDVYLRFAQLVNDNDQYQFKNERERDSYKKAIQQAISNKRKNKTAKACKEVIKTHFPAIYRAIKAIHISGSSVQKKLQEIEASIVVDSFVNAEFWCLPIHDSLLVRVSDADKAVAALNKRAFDVLGFELKFKQK